MVSNLDAKSKDPKLNFGGIFPKNSLFDDVDYSWQYWLGGKPLNQKNQWREQISKKVIHGNKTYELKQRAQQKQLSDHSRFYDQNFSTVNLETEDSNSNHGKTFLTLLFHRLCRLELKVLAKKGTTWHKNQGSEQSTKKLVMITKPNSKSHSHNIGISWITVGSMV